MRAPRIQLDDIALLFGSTAAVDGVSLSVQAGEVHCLLGPSGCGKTSTLRVAAGVERPDRGTVRIDGEIVAGPDRFLPPEDRRVGLIFQDYALFPHLTVAQNVAFGLKGLPRAEKGTRVTEALRRVELAGFEDAYPHTLSGGQQQRVALARALAPRPVVMLMDEPFSGLDRRLRDRVRDDTLNVLDQLDTAVILVTHDPEEAFRMGDAVSLMRGGKIVQTGSPHDVYAQPADRLAAAFFGDANFLAGLAENGQVQTPLGSVSADLADGTEVDVMLRPHDVMVSVNGTGNATVVRARSIGPDLLVHAALGADVVEIRLRESLDLEAGQPVQLQIRPGRAQLFPKQA